MAFPTMTFTNMWQPGQPLDFGTVFFDDFIEDTFSATADTTTWLTTLTGATPTTVIGDDEMGGVLHITTSAADDDSAECQVNGEAFAVTANKDIYFAARLKVTAAASPLTTVDWCIGLATTDTAVMDGTEEFIGFGTSNGSGAMLNAGAANIYSILQNDTGSAGWAADDFTDTGIDWVDDTFFTVAFWVQSNTRVRFYVNGSEKSVKTTNIPTGDAVTPTICIQNNAAAAKQLLVDYIYCAQAR